MPAARSSDAFLRAGVRCAVTYERAVDVDVVEERSAEEVGSRVLPFVEHDLNPEDRAGHRLQSGDRARGAEAHQRPRGSAPTQADPAAARCLDQAGWRVTADEVEVRRRLDIPARCARTAVRAKRAGAVTA